jgi:hypothetical protein
MEAFMTAGETARKNYEMARWEITERIQIRDQVLLVYLGAVGTIFGIALGTSSKPEILLVTPYLTLGAAIIVSQHNSVIGALGSFVAHELESFLREIGEYAPQWDTSAVLGSYSVRMVWLRTLGHLLLLSSPPVVGLIANWWYGFYSPFPNWIIWWFGLVCTGLSLFLLLESHSWRRRLHKKDMECLET